MYREIEREKRIHTCLHPLLHYHTENILIKISIYIYIYYRNFIPPRAEVCLRVHTRTHIYKCISYTHDIHCRNTFSRTLVPYPRSLHGMEPICTITSTTTTTEAAKDMPGGRTHPHTSKIFLQIAERLVCWQILYYLSLCARASDLPLPLSYQDHHFSGDDLDGSDWHRHFWTPHLHGRGHRNLGRPCFPESGFNM